MIGEYLIDSTDDNGYITADISEVAAFLNVQEDTVLLVLNELQTIDPPGICARNLQECLLLQLQQLEEIDEVAMLVVRDYLDELACDDAKTVALAEKLPVERIRKVFKTVRSLEPKPGREFYHHEVERPVIPDILVRETGEDFGILYNDEAFPAICVSESFTRGAEGFNDSEAGEYVHDKVKSAVWFIKCLEQRKNILTAIAQRICELQQDFFRTGPKELRHIDRLQFAAVMDMHESILDNAIHEKYLQCRWGVFEFASFFTGPDDYNDSFATGMSFL
jgi:RNA polymerase sigma-54 factor